MRQAGYSEDYRGFRYTDPGAPAPPVTKDTLIRAYKDGQQAATTWPRPESPYAGVSKALDYLWRAGLESKEQPRTRRLRVQAEQLIKSGEIRTGG